MSARPPRRVLPLLLISGLGALLSAGGCAEPKYAEVPEGDGSSGETGTPDDDTGTGGGAGTDGTEGGDEGTDDPPVDTDGDGVPDAEDCRPEDPDIYPGATEIPYDGIDQDCVGGDLRDVDGDGYEAEVVGGEDCDDENASVNPDSIDEDNDFDDDCDGVIDEDVIVDYDRWPVVFGKDTGTVRGLGAHPLPAGGAVISCAFDGEIDIDPDPRELVPREAEGAGDDILFVAFADDRSLAMDFAISSDGDLSLSSTEVDGGGGFLLSGSFSGTVDFDDATPTFVRRSNGGGDGWFARFSDTGDIGWAYSIGGSDDDEISAALDTSAGTAVTGTLVSANLNPAGTAAASVNVNSAGLHDGFVAMYDFTQQLLWHGLVGGSEATDAAEIVDVIELGGTLYLLGAFSGTVDLDPDDSATDTVTATGAQDAFVLALDAATGAHIASATLGSAGTTLVPVAIATDGSSIAVTGTADGSLDLGTGPVATAGVDVFALTLRDRRAHV